MTRTLDGYSGDSFKVGVKLSLSDEDIRARLKSDDFLKSYRTFMWNTFDGVMYIHAAGSEILTPEGFDSHPLFHVDEMLARSKDYIAPDELYSDVEHPVLLLGTPDEGHFNDWLGRHTITARLTSVYPKLTIVRKEDTIEINYLNPEPKKSSISVADFVRGMKSFAERADEWARAVNLPREHPPFEEFYRNIEKTLALE